MNHLKFLLVAISMAIVVGCDSPLAGLPDDAFQAESDATNTLAWVSFEQLPEPGEEDKRPDRKVGKCDNCRGSGRSGDGLGRCNVCKGDGRIDREDLAKQERPVIDIESLVKSNAVQELLSPKPQPVTEIVTKPKAEQVKTIVTLHASPSTLKGWPIRFWKVDRKKLLDLGVEVPKPDTRKGNPFVTVCRGDRCIKIEGHPTYEQILQQIEKIEL